MVCPRCQGNGNLVQLSFKVNVNGTTIAPTCVPLTAPAPDLRACTDCGGTGKYT